MTKHKISREVFEDLESEEFDVRDDYSGRSMYGKRCLALTGTLASLIRFVMHIQWLNDQGTAGLSDFSAWIDNVTSDSMGYDTIYYWPSVEVER